MWPTPRWEGQIQMDPMVRTELDKVRLTIHDALVGGSFLLCYLGWFQELDKLRPAGM